MKTKSNRREFIQTFGAAFAGLTLVPRHVLSATPPTAPVSVARCAEYGPQVRSTLATIFDQLGGLSRLVSGKTVALKINMTGTYTDTLRRMPNGVTYWVHPEVIGSTIHLLGQAGARRIVLVEGTLNP